MSINDYYRPINMHRINTYLRDNKLYIAVHPDDNDIRKTHWHFANVDVIFPNMFDFDIHNYVDEVIEYDRRKIVSYIISGKTVRISTLLNYGDNNIYCYYSSNYVTNYTSINNDTVILYFLRLIIENGTYTYKLSSIKIPKHMIQSEVDAIIPRNDDKMFLKFIDHNGDVSDITLKMPGDTFNIDIGNYDECSKLIIDESMMNYAKLLLNKI